MSFVFVTLMQCGLNWNMMMQNSLYFKYYLVVFVV